MTAISSSTEYHKNGIVTAKNVTASSDDNMQHSQSESILATKESSTTSTEPSTTTTAASEHFGIDQVYVDFLEEAQRRSEADFATSHTRSKRGVVIGPVEGNFQRHALRGT